MWKLDERWFKGPGEYNIEAGDKKATLTVDENRHFRTLHGETKWFPIYGFARVVMPTDPNKP